MEKIAEYILEEKIAETRNSIIYKGKKADESHSVIVKMLKTRYPSPTEIARFRLEYNLVKNLDIEGIVKTRALVEENNTFAIIEEDFNGISLREFIKANTIDLATFLKIGSRIALILGNIHEHNIIHLDIKPGNILINPADGTIKITDFGISSILTHANDEIYNPDVIMGTLSYISPEQTGRMNKSIDYRTDMYSLGVTFYELETSRLPFQSHDPMELIHSHIAREPAAPNEANGSIPSVVSRIIMKLLSKAPEERYQNCFGLAADLDECGRRLSSTGRIDDFDLGSKDVSIKFNVPQVIIGRERELNALMAAFARTKNGKSELMLVLGDPGIGKSALINEIHKPIVASKGYFIAGKYDQFRHDIPYSGIIQAFQILMKQILTESDERIVLWKEKLLVALGPNGKVISSVIPELELIIGKQPDVPELPSEESGNRFNMVFESFVSVFAKKEHPLVIFLDDLQWADLASFKLIRIITGGNTPRSLLLICAYRSNEVSPHHPLAVTIDAIEKGGHAIERIMLEPLTSDSINRIVFNILRTDTEKTRALAEDILKKTAGNPFFVIQFLKNLYDRKVIFLNSRTGWEWDSLKIGQMEVTDNVVEFMAKKISTLPGNTRRILELCACIGNRFDLETISIISGKSIDEVLADLTGAIREDLVHLDGNMYRFHHDRIQEAAYSLLSEDEKTSMHFKIGTTVLGKTDKNILPLKIFYIVGQLNRGSMLITDPVSKTRLAELNFVACSKARASAAFASAAVYAKAGMGLLAGNCWTDNYKLTYGLYMMRMECEYLLLNFDESEKMFAEIKEHVQSNVEKAKAYIQMILLYGSVQKYKESLALGRDAMKLIGHALPERITKGMIISGLLAIYFKFRKLKIKIEDIANKPMTTDPNIAILHGLSISMGTIAYLSDTNLWSYLIIKGVYNILTYGNYEYSGLTLVLFGSILCSALGFYEPGYKFGATGLLINKKLGNKRSSGLSNWAFGSFTRHWQNHARLSVDLIREAYAINLEMGNLVYANHSVNVLCATRIILGDNLAEVIEENERYRGFQLGSKDPFVALNYRINHQMCLCLRGGTSRKGTLDSEGFSEEEILRKYRDRGILIGEFFLRFIQLRINYLFGEYTKCIPLIEELHHLMHDKEIARGYLHTTEAVFYSSLAMIALLPAAGRTERKKYKKLLAFNQKKMKTWASHCRENFLHKYLLVQAELSAVSGKKRKARTLYDEAIRSAHENKYVQNEGIVNERAALLMKSMKKNDSAREYMKNARYCYVLWGADSKVKQLDETYPEFLADKAGEVPEKGTKPDTIERRSGSGSGTDTLDLTTIIRTSQTLSGEIDLEKLLIHIMTLSIENAGAQQGWLIVENEHSKKLCIEVRGKTDGAAILASEPLETCGDVALTVVNLVHKTGSDIVLADAFADDRFLNDPYIIRKKPKSILCSAIRHKGSIIGILYLENNLVTHAFTESRIELMKILSAQAAISIENSRLITHREKAAKLETEMNLAKKIQTVLLPRNPKIPGYDIAAYMNPADNVGGDYYDVINSRGIDRVVIGDVSGHGVPAGLVMMMVQTSIHTTLDQYPDISPAELLTRVNKTITSNIRLLGDSKYMTISVLGVRKDVFTFAGAHLDILIFRAKEMRVERLETAGMWIGLLDDITPMTRDNTFIVEPGDTVLLYTDGIIEAWRKTSAKNERTEENMFGMEKLVAFFCSIGSLSTKEIIDKILKEVADNYLPTDDVSLVAIKRLASG